MTSADLLAEPRWAGLALSEVPTPCFVCDTAALDRNLAILGDVQARSGCEILLALKGFALWRLFPRIAKVLAGVTASGIHEARLGAQRFGGQVHACGPAFSDTEFDALLGLCDHIVLNSLSQLSRLQPRAAAFAANGGTPVQLGLRVNPEHREVEVAMYDPCGPGSRLGITASEMTPDALQDVDGLHFHTLCELGSDALARTLAAFEAGFAPYIPDRRWINMGGGHHITRPDYDTDLLVSLVGRFSERHQVQVYLEPGEAIALNTGVLVTTVLDVIKRDVDIAILDTSATAHMPDVLEMPYRPSVVGAGKPGEKPHTVRLGGVSCLAGDVIGEYAFDRPLRVGDRLVFEDMIHYTMVKTTTFNGVCLPSIAIGDSRDGSLEVVRTFGFEDYESRLS